MSNPNNDIDLTATMPCKDSISALGFRPSQSYPTFLHAYERLPLTRHPLLRRPNFSSPPHKSLSQLGLNIESMIFGKIWS